MFYNICSTDVKTFDPGVKAKLDSESEDEVLMATSIPLKEELLSSDLDSDDLSERGIPVGIDDF